MNELQFDAVYPHTLDFRKCRGRDEGWVGSDDADLGNSDRVIGGLGSMLEPDVVGEQRDAEIAERVRAGALEDGRAREDDAVDAFDGRARSSGTREGLH